LKDWHTSVAGWLYWLVTNKVVLLSVGGAAGTNARYWLGVLLKPYALNMQLPFLATMVINVTGSLVLGVFTGLFVARMRPEHDALFLLLGVGFCGGYTTFSTFEYETFALVRDGSWWLALVNVVVSVVAGFFAVALAYSLAARQS
jgi:CrcB protein